MGRTFTSFLPSLGGCEPTDCAVWSSRTVGLSFGCCYEHRSGPTFAVFVFRYSPVSAATQLLKLLYWGLSLMLSVPMFRSRPCMTDHTCWYKFSVVTWSAVTIQSYPSTRCSISACLSAAFSGLLQLCSGIWIHSH